jgi:hypothetical protein
MQVLRLWAPIVASCLAATSCSMAKFGYDTLPTWAQWQVQRYFDLDDAQRELVSRHLDDLHRWHRRSQLPQYVGFLQEVDDGLRTRVDAADIGRWRDRIGEAWAPVADRLAPGLAELALTLRPEQIERARKRLDERSEELRRDYLPEGKPSDEARAERVVKRAEFFLGRLGRQQKRELEALAAALPATEETWLAERESRQRRFVALLNRIHREKPPRAEAVRWCREYLEGMWQPHDQRRRHRLDAAIAASDQLSAEMLARATPAQRAHLSKLVRGYAEDFGTLAGLKVAAR